MAPGGEVPPRTLVVGTPARPVRELTAGEIREQRARTLGYVRDAREYASVHGG